MDHLELAELNEASFWAQVDSSEGPDACWPWTGRKRGLESLRGRSKLLGPEMYSSKVAWILTHKKYPSHKVLHCCPKGSNSNCCNPTHLYDGTAKQNVLDCIREGHYRNGLKMHPERASRGAAHYLRRHPELVIRGAKNVKAKLSDSAVAKIRQAYATGRYTQRELAFHFGVHDSTISVVVNNLHYVVAVQS